MLVLIVVTAATAFAAFVATYQKQVQTQQAQAHARSLESLRVLGVHPTAAAGSTITRINLTIASLSVESSGVTGILIDDAPLLVYTATGDISGALNLSAPIAFTIVAFGQVLISASFPSNPIPLDLTKYIKIEVLTSLDNSFIQVFVPPTAIAQVSTIQTFAGGVPATVPLLDGSESFPMGNATIVSWTWTVTPVGTSPTPSCAGSFAGEQVVVPHTCQALGTPVNYYANLTATDSTGLLGKSSTVFSY